MVVLNIKRLPKEEHSKDYDEFCVYFPATTIVGEACDLVTRLQNLRVRLSWMVLSGKELIKEAADETAKAQLGGPVGEAERYMSLERAQSHKPAQECVDEVLLLCETIKGAAMIAFPAECSGADAQRRLADVLDNEESDDKARAKAHRLLSLLDDQAVTPAILQGPTTLWWSGRALDKTVELSKYTGRNDKTKLVVKIQADGHSAPPREPGLDARTQSEMMAYWYKKQEEQKKLVEDEDISFANAEWANPRGLKSQLLGMGGVQFRPR